MWTPTPLATKIALVREAMSGLIGKSLTKYETAELLSDEGTWEAWPDLPIRLYTDSETVVSVSWSGFDDLWIEQGMKLPFLAEGVTVRWIQNGISKIQSAVGNVMHAVLLGRGEMSIEGRDLEIWTRLLIECEGGWSAIFNALDENGYAFHTTMPSGSFVKCI